MKIFNIFKPKCVGWYCDKQTIVGKKGDICDYCTRKGREQSERMKRDETTTTTENRYRDLPVGTKLLVGGKIGEITGYRYIYDGLYFSRASVIYEVKISESTYTYVYMTRAQVVVEKDVEVS